MIYNEELTAFRCLQKLFLVTAMFLIICLLAIVILYTYELQTKLKDLNGENIKLLDGMHEGLLILSKANKNVMFCNKPSQKLLLGAMSYLEEHQ